MARPSSLNRDYKLPSPKARSGFRPTRRHWLVSGAALGITIMLLVVNTQGEATLGRSQTVETEPEQTGNLVRLPLDLPATHISNQEAALPLVNPADVSTTPATKRATASATDPVIDDDSWHMTRVRQGESLSLIFTRLGFSAAELQSMLSLGGDVRRLEHLFPGDELRYRTTSNGGIDALAYRYDEGHSLIVERQDNGFQSRTIEHEIEHRMRMAKATIDDSLFLAAQRTGLSDRLTMELAGIFGWDIDFALDIRKGDEFAVIFEERYQNGEKIGDGDIIAASFTNQGKTYRALRYDDGHYYTPEGKSMRKAFLRTPVKFTRISSRFSLGRRHPILHRIRAHHGVDYAAPSGTPIKATGDGKVEFIGRKGGYGRVIILKHGSRYSTVYAHLSRYRRGLHRGSHVRQGETIGYVGMSGLATGPHLHYEFRVNGVHRNPLTVRLPDAAPLPRHKLAQFKARTAPLLAQLDILSQTPTQLAKR